MNAKLYFMYIFQDMIIVLYGWSINLLRAMHSSFGGQVLKLKKRASHYPVIYEK